MTKETIIRIEECTFNKDDIETLRTALAKAILGDPIDGSCIPAFQRIVAAFAGDTQPEKVVRDGLVAVCYSPTFGAGWSTWNEEYENIALFHPKIVQWIEGGKKEDIDEIMQGLIGRDESCHNFYTGGAKDLRIEWLPVGTPFSVTEYDGSESITTQTAQYFKVA